MSLADAAPFAVAAWPFDEDFADQVGDNDLTNNNGVTLAPGKFGNAAEFGSADTLGRTHTSDLALGGSSSWMLRLWINSADWSGFSSRSVLSKGSSVILFKQPFSSILVFQVFDSLGSATAVSLSLPTTNAWHLIHAWFDSINNQIGFSIDAGTPATASHPSVQTDTGDFQLGSGYEGLIDDPVLLKNYVLDATERTEDWDSGDGVVFANWLPAVPPASTTIPKRRGLTQVKNRRSLVQAKPRRTLIQVKDRS